MSPIRRPRFLWQFPAYIPALIGEIVTDPVLNKRYQSEQDRNQTMRNIWPITVILWYMLKVKDTKYECLPPSWSKNVSS